MSLTLVATPIGNLDDITLRAIQVLKNCDVLIGEEFKEASKLLKKLGLEQKEIYLLNEHSKESDVNDLVQLCKNSNVALVTDCGTPSFSDPGWQLVKKCRENKIHVGSVPGASSLMTLISLSSTRLETFIFMGFLPQDKIERQKSYKKISDAKDNIILMDTPYRLNSLLEDLAKIIPNKKALIGIDLTHQNEEVYENSVSKISTMIPKSKREFILLIYR